jgi:hypothetical protein
VQQLPTTVCRVGPELHQGTNEQRGRGLLSGVLWSVRRSQLQRAPGRCRVVLLQADYHDPAILQRARTALRRRYSSVVGHPVHDDVDDDNDGAATAGGVVVVAGASF